MLSLWLLAAMAKLIAAVSIMNGSESLVLPSWTPAGCVTAMGSDIDCHPTYVQYLTSPDDTVGWTTSMLNSLCTPGCKTSLSSLHDKVRTACAGSSFRFGYGNNLTFEQIVEIRQHKYEIACMQDDGKAYCLDVEKTWNISKLVSSGTVRWPNNTVKLFPDYTTDEPDAVHLFGNGTALPLDWIVADSGSLTTDAQVRGTEQNNRAAVDYYTDRSKVQYSNYGHNKALNWDEYPLQIQCSSCFLSKFEYGISSAWGNIYDEITAQVWSNMKKNCGIDRQLTPANNVTGGNMFSNTTRLLANGTSRCTRYITPKNPKQDVLSFAISNHVAYATLVGMNGIETLNVGSNALCAPSACDVKVFFNNTENQLGTAAQIVAVSDFSMAEFLSWNPYIRSSAIGSGEAVCVGPWGPAYQPNNETVIYPSTTYSTTAKPAAPTANGTIANCGLYYNVTTGDYCNKISQKFGITAKQFLAMNPSINSNCTNLLPGRDYCVAPCCKGSVTSSLSSIASSTVSSTPTSSVASPTSSSVSKSASTVSSPAPTASGTTKLCLLWFTVKTGDVCKTVQGLFDITLAQFIYWNPSVGASCQLTVGVQYCVLGPPLPLTVPLLGITLGL